MLEKPLWGISFTLCELLMDDVRICKLLVTTMSMPIVRPMGFIESSLTLVPIVNRYIHLPERAQARQDTAANPGAV